MLKEEFCLEVGHGVWHLEACDLKMSAQKVLCSLALDHGCGDIRTIKHVRGDMLDTMDQNVSKELRSLFPCVAPETLRAMGGPDSATLDLQLHMAEVILGQYDAYPCGQKASCKKCRKDCVVWGRPEAEDVEEHLPYDRCEMDVFMAGFTCKDWSSRGCGMGCGGPSFLPFLTMIFELRAKRYKVAILECTKSQPDSLILYFLSDMYYIDSVVLCPSDFGWPVERRRKWPQ